jgi:hypothetical protein
MDLDKASVSAQVQTLKTNFVKLATDPATTPEKLTLEYMNYFKYFDTNPLKSGGQINQILMLNGANTF